MNYYNNIEVIADFDVVIVGGGPAGLAAAISASELGAKVLIIEKAGVIGGNLTIGHVGPTMGNFEKNTMADRFKNLLTDGVHIAQDFEMAKIKLMQLVKKYGICVYLNTAFADIVKKDGLITHAIIATQNGLKAVSGKIFIDASGDGVLAYLAGEDTEIGRNDGLTQPVSVMFTVGGIDENQTIVCRHEEMDTPLKKGNYLQLCKDACKNGELPPTINIVRLYPCLSKTERMVNATQVNKVNALDLNDYTSSQIDLREQMLTVLNFLKNNVEGFEKAYIKDSSDIVGVRETRRVKGLYTLTAEDLIAGRRFDDVIVHRASFPLDIHNPNGAGQAESDTVPVKVKEYDIPYRSTVPQKTKNLYLAGRCISGTHRAHASYRVMNIVINIGEAVGIGAALCVKENVFPSTLDYKKIQNVLTERNINLFL